MKELNKLLMNMKLLRDPQKGCPWNKVQTIDSIKAFTLEEAYEVVDAIDRNDIEGLKNELGDLLFHIIFYTEMADENDHFNFHDVLKDLNEKLERRHPNVFTNNKVVNVEQVKTLWEEIKQQERNNRVNKSINLLDDVDKHMPAIIRAEKLQKCAATVGFDWTNSQEILNKIDEELNELRHAIQEPSNNADISEELGDLMFCCVNLARYYKINCETSLRDTNEKFISRFNYIEETLKKSNKSLSEATLEEMDELWNTAKKLAKL